MEEKSKLQFKKVANVFRTLALCFAIMLLSCSISRSSLYFSAVFNISGVFLHRLSTLVLSHHFVFLLGNAIIVILFVKFACENQSVADGHSFGDDKYLISEVLLDPAVSDENETVTDLDFPISWREIADQVRKCRRSISEDENDLDYNQMQLRRSVSEPRRKTENSQKERLDVDDLSNEEFQREVEAFIERQWRFLRDESLAVVSA